MKKTILIFGFVTLFCSCGRFSLYDSDKGASIVSVGSNTLYEDDLAGIYNASMSSKDSAMQKEMFVNMWVKNQVKQLNAEQLMDKSLPEIEKMVQEYRHTLITHKFEEQYVETRLDTVIVGEQIETYYKDNIANFKLAGPLVKARIARIPSGLRQSDRLSKMFYSAKESDLKDFLNICNKNDYKVVDFTTSWVDFSQVLQNIPFSNTDFDTFLRSKSIYEVEDDQYKYLMHIKEYLLTGSNAPIESQKQNIKKILLHNRRNTLIKSLEDSLYNDAVAKKEVEFY